MALGHSPHRDVAHHHPKIRRVTRGGWAWECSCGGSSPRAHTEPTSWAAIVIDALRHSQLIAP